MTLFNDLEHKYFSPASDQERMMLRRKGNIAMTVPSYLAIKPPALPDYTQAVLALIVQGRKGLLSRHTKLKEEIVKYPGSP